MNRNRAIASSPVRTAAATWQAITELAVVTLDRSPEIDGSDVSRTFDTIKAAGCALVAAGYTDDRPLVIDAPPLQLTIRTVSGVEAFGALDDENSNPVPGAATSDAWTLHLPRPEGLAALVDEVASGVSNVSTGESRKQSALAGTPPTLDLRRLDPDFQEKQR